MLKYIVIIGAIVELAGKYIYIKDTLKGNTKPNKVTWLLWGIAPIIATFAALSAGVRWAVLPIFATGLGCLIVFVVSFLNPKSYWKLEKLDYFCGICSILALILWAITKEPIIAIIFSIASDGFASLPTVIKSWKYPETESGLTYVASLFNSLTSFFALKTLTFSELAFPVYLTIICSLLVISNYKKLFKSKK
jgi:hypothetical protein